MNVLLLTMFVSLLLVAFFAVAFLWSQRSGASNPERESLMPLADEIPVSGRKSTSGLPATLSPLPDQIQTHNP